MILLKLALNNIKKYKRESSLVITSVALTVSLMTLVALFMNSMFVSSVQYDKDDKQINAHVDGIENVEKFIQQIGEEYLDYYVLTNPSLLLEHPDYQWPITNKNLILSVNGDEIDFDDDNKIIEGRDSNGINEIVVNEHFELNIGDTLSMSVYDAGKVVQTIDVTIVGKVKGLEDPYYKRPLSELINDDFNNNLALVFKEGSKDIDLLLDGLVDSGEFGYYARIMYNSNYNYVNGFTSEPTFSAYMMFISTILLMIIIASVSFSFIMNAFDTLFNQRDNTYDILKSVGTTKRQMQLILTFEGVLLSIVGIVFGAFIGYGLTRLLINFIVKTLSPWSNIYGSFLGLTLIRFYSRNAIYIGILIITLVIVLISLWVKTNRIYKTAPNTPDNLCCNVINIQEIKDGKIMKELAKINVKSTKEFNGVKHAIIISTILLISVSSFITNVIRASDENMEQPNLKITANNYGSFDYDDLMNDVKLIFDKYNKQFLDKQTYARTERIKVDATKHRAHPSNTTFKISDSNYEIIILDNITFDHISMFYKPQKSLNTMFVNVRDSYEEEDETKFVEIVDIDDNEVLHIVTESSRNIQKEREISIPIDTVIKNDEIYYREDAFLPGSIIIRESYYQENLLSDLPITSLDILIISNVKPNEVERIQEEFSNLDTVYDFYIYNTLIENQSMLAFKEIAIISMYSLYAYVTIVTIINMVNISITNYRRRTKDFAILRSVGADDNQIKKMHFYESLFVIGKSWVIGLVFGFLITLSVYYGFGRLLFGEAIPRFIIPLGAVFISLGVALIGMLVQRLVINSELKKTSIIDDIKQY